MKLSSIFKAVFVLAALTFAFWAVRNFSTQSKKEESMVGKKLLAKETLALTRGIVFKTKGSVAPLKVQREGDRWILPNFYDLNADFRKLTETTDHLLEASYTRMVTESKDPEKLARYELGDFAVDLLDEAGKTLWSVRAGKPGPGGGKFVRVGNGEEAPVYLANISLYYDTNGENWAEKNLFSFKPEEVQKVEFYLPKEKQPLAIQRESETAPFKAEGLKKGEEVKQSAVKTLILDLAQARFEKILPGDDKKAASAKENARKTQFTLFNGDQYEIAIGKSVTEEKKASGKKKKGEDKAAEKEKEMTFIFVKYPKETALANVFQSQSVKVFDNLLEKLPSSRESVVEKKKEEVKKAGGEAEKKTPKKK